jgi:hypothetical protein
MDIDGILLLTSINISIYHLVCAYCRSTLEFSGSIVVIKASECFRDTIIFAMDGRKGYRCHSIKELLEQIRAMCVRFIVSASKKSSYL